MGLFDKLKSLVSDDKKDSGTIEIVAPLSGEIVNIEDVPDVVFAEKIVGDGIAIKPTGNKMVLQLTAPSVKFLKPTMRSLSNLIAVSNCSFTSVSTPLN